VPIVEAGDPAPPFELEDHSGNRVRLDNLRGHWVILYWYPKDDTPGCTTEACEFRDNWEAVSAVAEVYGVSPDTVKSHGKFREKFRLPFPLLSDEGHAVAQRYGVWAMKKFMGRSYMGVERTTFIIGPDGRVARVFQNVKPSGHAKEVLKALAEVKGKG